MCKSQEVEALFTRAPRLIILRQRRRPEVEQAGLGWVKGQSVLAEAFRQHVHHPASVLFLREDHDRIVRKADHERPALKPWLHVLFEPHVQGIMQIDVRETG